jgi:hypothetical protein
MATPFAVTLIGLSSVLWRWRGGGVSVVFVACCIASSCYTTSNPLIYPILQSKTILMKTTGIYDPSSEVIWPPEYGTDLPWGKGVVVPAGTQLRFLRVEESHRDLSDQTTLVLEHKGVTVQILDPYWKQMLALEHPVRSPLGAALGDLMCYLAFPEMMSSIVGRFLPTR